MDINEWIEAIRTRLSAIDLREISDTIAGTLGPMARDLAGMIEEWARAAGAMDESSLRLLAGGVAIASFCLAVALTIRLVRHRRRAAALPRAAVPPASRKSWTECAARVDRLAALGAGQGEVARAIGVPRDALALLAPTVDWSRSKLPTSAGSAVQTPARPRSTGGSHQVQMYVR